MIAAGVLERGEFYHKTLYKGHFGEFTKNGIYTAKVEMYAAWSEPQHICAYNCTRIKPGFGLSKGGHKLRPSR